MEKRNDGFLDVTSFFSDKDLERLPKNFSKVIDGKTYFFKKSDSFYGEMLAIELYKSLNIPIVEEIPVTINGTYFLMSKSFHRKFYKYFGGHDIIQKYLDSQGINIVADKFKTNYNNFETIWSALLYFNVDSQDIYKIMTGLVYYFYVSVILNDYDFEACNWEIETNDEKTNLVPKFDVECSFSDIDFISSFNVDVTDSYKCTVGSLEDFLKVSTPEYLIAFKSLLQRCDESLLYQGIDNLRTRYGKDLEEYLKLPENSHIIDNVINNFQKQRRLLLDLVAEMENKR